MTHDSIQHTLNHSIIHIYNKHPSFLSASNVPSTDNTQYRLVYQIDDKL